MCWLAQTFLTGLGMHDSGGQALLHGFEQQLGTCRDDRRWKLALASLLRLKIKAVPWKTAIMFRLSPAFRHEQDERQVPDNPEKVLNT